MRTEPARRPAAPAAGPSAASAPPSAAAADFNLLAHRAGDLLVLELEDRSAADGRAEAADLLFPLVQSLVGTLAAAGGPDEACRLAAREVRALIGFDRALVYRFDDAWDGTVVAEDRNDRLPSYFGQRFPASDIPAQARELYRLNPIRIIPDAGYAPVPLHAEPGHAAGHDGGHAGGPLDLTFAELRSVSPVHVEYMRNMGTGASMSVSLLVDGRLWGLISCHNRDPRRVPFPARTAAGFVGQVLSHQLTAQVRAAGFAERAELKTIQARLLARMAAAADDFERGLAADADDLLGLARAAGAAVVSADGPCLLVGRTPPEPAVRALADWLRSDVRDEVFATDRLADRFPPAAGYANQASGLLAIAVSKVRARYVLWFRPEVVETITWGGDPRGAKAPDPHTGRIHPRASFDAWKQTVRGRSTAWRPGEVEAAAELRNNVVGIVLRKAEELAGLTEELRRSNKELEAFSYSVSHDLRAPFRHIVGYAELLREMEGASLTDNAKRYLGTIVESAQYAGTLVDNLLLFSQMGRSTLSLGPVDANRLFAEAVAEARREAAGRQISIQVHPLPVVTADLMMLRLVAQNLLSNAVKYTRPRPAAEVEVGCRSDEAEHVFFVRDNGVGFDMRYADKLFGVFQRLHRMEEFEGTGIGLANVGRIVARHGGRAWADGAVGKGATFYFSLPRAESA